MKKEKATPYSVIAMVILILVSLTFIFPFYWIMTGAFKNPITIKTLPPELFPMNPSSDNFIKLFKSPAFLWLFNSVFISIMAMFLVCITASLAGYVLAKKHFTGRAFIFSMFVCAMALPKQVVLVPLVRLTQAIGLYNSVWAVILPTVGWPFGVFLMKQFSETVPGELMEAARIDGAGELRTFLEIILPIIKPGVGALAIFTFINTWNDYFLQLVMLVNKEVMTISLGVATLQAEFSTDYGTIMAGAALAAVPIVAVFIAFQKYFTQGITMGAVKG
jgi:multiple sugar transport system permease protein